MQAEFSFASSVVPTQISCVCVGGKGVCIHKSSKCTPTYPPPPPKKKKNLNKMGADDVMVMQSMP